MLEKLKVMLNPRKAAEDIMIKKIVVNATITILLSTTVTNAMVTNYTAKTLEEATSQANVVNHIAIDHNLFYSPVAEVVGQGGDIYLDKGDIGVVHKNGDIETFNLNDKFYSSVNKEGNIITNYIHSL